MTETPFFIGKKFEEKVARHFRNLGCLVVRTHRGMGDVDIVVVTPTEGIKVDGSNFAGTLLIQCKANGYVPPKERSTLEEFTARYWTEKTRIFVASENRQSYRKELEFKEVSLPPIIEQSPPGYQEATVRA